MGFVERWDHWTRGFPKGQTWLGRVKPGEGIPVVKRKEGRAGREEKASELDEGELKGVSGVYD
jgi:hypothetical protein